MHCGLAAVYFFINHLRYISFIKFPWLRESVESEDNLKKADGRLHCSVNLQMFRLSAQYVAASGPHHCLRYGSHFIWSLRLLLCAINFKLPLICSVLHLLQEAPHFNINECLSLSLPLQTNHAFLGSAQRIMMLKNRFHFSGWKSTGPGSVLT